MKLTNSDLRSLKIRGYDVHAISRIYGIPVPELEDQYEYVWNEQRRPDPTEQEIEAACLEIQQEWSDEERARRMVGKGRRWAPTVVPESLLTYAHNCGRGSSGSLEHTLRSAMS